MTIRAESSNGFIEFDGQSGRVTTVHEHPGSEGTLSPIQRVDINDLRGAYRGKSLPGQVDILECACWLADGTYCPSMVWDEEAMAFTEREAASVPVTDRANA